ncbi:hypothetical protein [Streptomyces sp. NBC_00847]|uniref:hypothetical protein n=1 Tax=Streptomyces sp. NBC_00847 TaxID=2975850 RepID=UPI00225C2FC8|nr:hypothetical protein [Streptomyces sp. NBC_00847]MCX4884752.1 hypothetical protein [Streptomyces sp. NBC_00847]
MKHSALAVTVLVCGIVIALLLSVLLGCATAVLARRDGHSPFEALGQATVMCAGSFSLTLTAIGLVASWVG